MDCCCREGPHLLSLVPNAGLTSLVSAQKAQREGRGRIGGMRSGACLCSGALLACAALLLLAPRAGEAQGLIMGDQMGSTPSLGRLLDPGPSTPTTPAATADSTADSGGATGATDSGAATGGGSGDAAGGGEGGNHLATDSREQNKGAIWLQSVHLVLAPAIRRHLICRCVCATEGA